jgi:ATP-dependent Lon protease
MSKHNNEYFDIVNRRLKLGPSVQGRDEIAIKKTVTGLLKIIHPSGEPTEEEFNEIVSYAIEGRRRVKEQMNKRKPDDEFAAINLSFFKGDGTEEIIYCPESKSSNASQNPRKEDIQETSIIESESLFEQPVSDVKDVQVKLIEKHLKVHYGDVGYGYETVFSAYLKGAEEITIEDPYIRQNHQISNFVKFCELAVKIGDVKQIKLITSADDEDQQRQNKYAFEQLANSLFENDIELEVEFSNTVHDRQIILSTGWRIILGRGIDYFQSLAGNYFQIGTNDQDLRACLENNIDFIKVN